MLFRHPSSLLSAFAFNASSTPRTAFQTLAALAAPFLVLVPAVFALTATGCTPSIGDSCQVSTNCSSSGDRLCDLSQPNGYCTIFNCQPNRCPDEAACVMFHPNVAGCYYNDRGQRSGKNFCAKKCESDSDCRGEYRCANPKERPLSAIVLDDNQNVRVCVPVPRQTQDAGAAPVPDGGSQPLVCLPGSKTTPDEIDGSVPRPDAGSDAGAPDAGDAGPRDGGG